MSDAAFLTGPPPGASPADPRPTPRQTFGLGESREPHELVKADALLCPFPSERWVGAFLFLGALALFLASMSWAPFPGLPIQTLLRHLGEDGAPPVLDPLWGCLVRVLARLRVGSVAAWTGAFSAVCGAAAVGLLGRLMVRVGYLVRNEAHPASFAREAQARRISGVVAGLYLICCVPFWLVSTRSLPASFHLLLLVGAAWFFSEYQLWGKQRHLALLGLAYGIGLAEFATFIVFLPLAAFLIAREMFRWKNLWRWRSQLVLWTALLLGLAVSPLHAWNLWRTGAAIGLFASPGQAWARMLQEQLLLIAAVRFYPGLPTIALITLVPWLTLFAVSRRSPWFYEIGQVLVRIVILAGLLGVLFDATYAPWQLLGMRRLMVTPYLLLAICMGYLAGEFWIMGEPQPLVDSPYARRHVRRARRASAALALLLPVVILAAGAFNWQKIDGRHGHVVESAAQEVLDRMGSRDLLFSIGLLDDSLRWSLWRQRSPVRLISIQRTGSPEYLGRLAQYFDADVLRQPLLEGDFGAFVEQLLASPEGPARVGFIDLADSFRPFGYLVPDGFLYRLETAADRVDVPALVAAQRPFWEQMERLARRPAPEKNLIRPFQDNLRLLASKVANNLGVMQAERGDETGALETFRTARRINSGNLSVRLNLLELNRRLALPVEAGLDADLEEWGAVPTEERWTLGLQFGYVWRARDWVRRGWVWAVSGDPATAEGVRLNPLYSAEEEGSRAKLIDQAYLLWGLPFQDETFWRLRLMQNGRDVEALLALGRLALRRNDSEAAAAYVDEAMAAGLPEAATGFDRAMAACVRGEKAQALAALKDLANRTPSDARPWVALALLGADDAPLQDQALKALKDLSAAGVGAKLALADILMTRQRWAEAKSVLEATVQLDAGNLHAWEMLGTLAQELRDQKLMELSLRALLARNPEHYLKYQNLGVNLYQQGELAQAEQAFRQGLRRKRDPVLLNNLATVLMERDGDPQEALALLDEALLRLPTHGGLYQTRGEIYLEVGRFEEARRDLQKALTILGSRDSALVLLARSYEGVGDFGRARAVAAALAKRLADLPAGQAQEVRDLLARLPAVQPAAGK